MADLLKYDTEGIIARCLLDFVKRGGIGKENVDEVTDAIVESLMLLGPMPLVRALHATVVPKTETIT